MNTIHESSSSSRAARRQRAEASANLATARELSLRALVAVSGIRLETFPEDERKSAATEIRKAAAAIRELRKLLPKE